MPGVRPMALFPFLATSTPARVVSINHTNMISSSPMVRPKDFPSPFSPRKPEVVIQDNIWFAPEVESSFTFPGFEALFGRQAPVCLEYCSGNGCWIAAKAASQGNHIWVAVEMKYKRIRKIWSKIQNLKLANLLGVCAEAESWTKRYVADGTIDHVYINFPDPWPKNKHTKNRLIDRPFIKEIARILKPGGQITIVTDHQGYCQSTLKFFLESADFGPLLEAPHHAPLTEDYGYSYFGALWREQGLNIHYIPFVRR